MVLRYIGAGISIKGILAFFIPDFEIWILFCILMKVVRLPDIAQWLGNMLFRGRKLAVWNKRNVLKTDVEKLTSRYGIDPISASIFLRRGLTEGRDLLYFLEDDLRFQHSPFLFSSMEDVVDRILDAVEENEKVLIFGDRDADGITSTSLLYSYLKKLGLDVTYRVPVENEPYGLTVETVEKFAADFGSLIITVDCGIVNNVEIDRAHELGLDVIVLDHHTPQQELPADTLIIDPECPDSTYPFSFISGCAVAYKVVSALRFSRSKWYKQDVALLDASAKGDSITIDCIKVRNLVPVKRISETVIPGETSISQTRLPSFLQGQMILVWNAKNVQTLLSRAFGSGCQFNVLDYSLEAQRIFPSLKDSTLSQMKSKSKLARYGNHEPTEIGAFYNLFVTCVQQDERLLHPNDVTDENFDLQLVALAAFADAMPLQNENRLFIRKAMSLMSKGIVRPGLAELMSLLKLYGKRVNSTDFGWTLVPNLNASGRLGHADYAVEMFISEDPDYREKMAEKICELNQERKTLTAQGISFVSDSLEKSRESFGNKMCFVADGRLAKGVCGLLAGHFMSKHNIPVVVMTFLDGMAIGSIRSPDEFDVMPFLSKYDKFEAFGGHPQAAGFSVLQENLEDFRNFLMAHSNEIVLEGKAEEVMDVDAEIPGAYMTLDLLKILDLFEPYGQKNDSLLFMAKNLPVVSASVIGKTEKLHLKLLVDSGKTKWPCMFWNRGDLLHNGIDTGDRVDILFNLDRNVFNGTETPQLYLVDIIKSQI